MLELSSYQIDLTQSLDCDVAVLLNITPDHLDRYDGFDAYAASKARLFAMQSADHVADHRRRGRLYPRHRCAGDAASASLVASTDIKDQSRWPALQGPHNAQNAAAAVAVARALGLADEAIARGPRHLSRPAAPHGARAREGRRPLRQRQQGDQPRPRPRRRSAPIPSIHWILGGLPKTDDLDECAPHFGHVRAAYTIGEAGPMFARLLAAHVPVTKLRDA